MRSDNRVPYDLTANVLEVFQDGGICLKPYRSDPRFNDAWWDDDHGPYACYFSIVDKYGVEVARAELEDVESEPWLHYPTLVDVHEYAELLFFEVACDTRLRGVGSAAVRLIAERMGRPLLAISEYADGFWRSLGWEEHLSVKPGHRSVFTEPRADSA